MHTIAAFAGMTKKSIPRVVGRRDVSFVFLAIAFKFQEVIVAAMAFAGEYTAGGGSRMIDGAAALLGIKEPADLAVNLVLLPAHDALVAVGFPEEFLLGPGERHVEVLGDAFGITVLHFNYGVGAAVARTFHAIV